MFILGFFFPQFEFGVASIFFGWVVSNVNFFLKE